METLINKLVANWIAFSDLEIAAIHDTEEGTWGWEIMIGPEGFLQSTEALSYGVVVQMSSINKGIRSYVESYLYSNRGPAVTLREVKKAQVLSQRSGQQVSESWVKSQMNRLNELESKVWKRADLMR